MEVSAPGCRQAEGKQALHPCFYLLGFNSKPGSPRQQFVILRARSLPPSADCDSRRHGVVSISVCGPHCHPILCMLCFAACQTSSGCAPGPRLATDPGQKPRCQTQLPSSTVAAERLGIPQRPSNCPRHNYLFIRRPRQK